MAKERSPRMKSRPSPDTELGRLAAWAAGNSDRTAGLWGAEAIRVLRLADERVSRGLNARGASMGTEEVKGVEKAGKFCWFAELGRLLNQLFGKAGEG